MCVRVMSRSLLFNQGKVPFSQAVCKFDWKVRLLDHGVALVDEKFTMFTYLE